MESEIQRGSDATTADATSDATAPTQPLSPEQLAKRQAELRRNREAAKRAAAEGIAQPTAPTTPTTAPTTSETKRAVAELLADSEKGIAEAEEKAAEEKAEQQRKHAERFPSVLDTHHAPKIPIDTISKCLRKSDAGYCDLINFMYPDCIKYDNSDESFYVWNGSHMQQNATGTLKNILMRKLHRVISNGYFELDKSIKTLTGEIDEIEKAETDKAKAEADTKADTDTKADKEAKAADRAADKKAKVKELQKLQNLQSTFKEGRKLKHELVLKNGVSDNIIKWARSQFGIDGSEWDQCQDALPVANGLINLKNGKLELTTPSMMIKNYSDIEYKGLSEPCPTWLSAFNQIMWGNDDKKIYLQKLFGMSLLGRQLEHVFPILYGKDGRNGKDLLTGTITKALGPMASKVHKTVILKPKRGVNDTGLSPQLMQLKGLRFAYVNETEQGDIIDQAQLKELTGGGYISARGMRENMQRFSPSYILFLTTNTKPHIRANDRAIWERTRVIELLADFQDNPDPDEPNQFKKDTRLDDKLEPELSGILSWLVRGCIDYQDNGIETPQSVMDTTAKYREEEDTVGKFINECCDVKADEKCKSTELYDVYKLWCDENGIKAMSSEALGKILADKGFEKRKSSVMTYFGITIMSNAEENQ